MLCHVVNFVSTETRWIQITNLRFDALTIKIPIYGSGDFCNDLILAFIDHKI